MSRLKHGITLYGFGSSFVHGDATLEDVLDKAKAIGCDGIEIVAPQMVTGHPNPSVEWMDYFKDICAQRELDPVCYSIYVDSGKHKGRFTREAERMTDAVASMEFAKYMGFKVVRSQDALLPTTMEKLLPYAEELGIHLAIELHGPYCPTTPIFQEYYNLFERKNSDYLGIVMDYSAFASGAPGNVLAGIPDAAVHKDILNKINHLYATTEIPEKELVDMIYAEGGDEADEYAARKLLFSIDPYTAKFGTPYWRTHPDYDGFRRLLKYSKYMHGKFFYVNEDLESPGIDYENYVRIMKEENYTGYIASEYEGTDPDDTEQIKRHIAMLDKYWDKY